MAAYADYKYYHDTYGGVAIPEPSFASYSAAASREIDALTLYRIPGGYIVDDKVRNAVCAVADISYNADQTESATGNIASETVGHHSVTYNVVKAENKDATLKKRISGAASEHLATTGLLYRGFRPGGC